MEVSPGALEFTGSFTKQTTEYLTLSNPTRQPLAFKVKTTAPKLYCVRPNASVLQPGESQQVSIILQGFSQPLPQDYKCKDKFLLVSVPAPPHADASKVSEIWPRLEAQNKSAVVSKKLRVSYLVGPDKQEQQPAQAHHDSAAPAAAAAGGAGAYGAANHYQQQQQQQQQQTPPQQQQQQQPPQHHQQAPPQQQQQQQSPFGQTAGGSTGYNYQQNGDASYNQPRSANDSSNGYSGYQQQPPPQQHYQQQQGGYNSFGGQQQASSPAVQRELEALARQVQTLSNKLDQNEKAASRSPVSAIVDSDLTATGLSLPVALVLILISFLVGWLVF
ncbi:uncharacterized protein LODBEIA_P41580 [Lodderomyces beijingensis]|uniref:MSP domain-containing protein n=1 Tax=Lodderomyces beijingensis TaxID=1775926 RepID=A0ABP0ZPU3_9ASCO